MSEWQPAWLDDATIRKVLLIAADEGLHDGEIIWARGEDDRLRCFVLANDLFYWGTADGEQITPENVDTLAAAIAEVEALVEFEGGTWGPLLFAARERGMRPQRPYYRNMPEPLKPLFDAAGPEGTQQ